MGPDNIPEKKFWESPNVQLKLPYVRHSLRQQTKWKKLDWFEVIQGQEILDHIDKKMYKIFYTDSLSKVDMGVNVEAFSLDKNPEGKASFHWYQISGNLPETHTHTHTHKSNTKKK